MRFGGISLSFGPMLGREFEQRVGIGRGLGGAKAASPDHGRDICDDG